MTILYQQILILILALMGKVQSTEVQLLDRKLYHLRSGLQREWFEFPEKAEGKELTKSFLAEANGTEWALRLRQRDVKQIWRILLNDRELGRLLQNENDMVSYWPVPPGTVVTGKNTLKILSARDQPVDDVLVGEIRLHHRPRDDVLRQASVRVTVVDADNAGPLPCRLTLVDANGSLAALGTASDNHLAVTAGMIYTSDGKADFHAAAGDYTLYAGRGFEYSVAKTRLALVPGSTAVRQLRIRREVPTPGLVSCDTHTHTLTHSGHGDASVSERVLTIAGEGIELPIATEHNKAADYDAAARASGVRRYFTPLIGSEVTTTVGHFNVFPILPGSVVPDHRVTDWRALFASIHNNPGVQVVVLNHPRDLHAGYRPFGSEHYNALTGENLAGWPFEAHAIEVVNSGALQSDPMRLYRDWFALLNRGYAVTGVGSSDSHDVGRTLLGQARTYVHCPDSDPERIDLARVFQSFREGRILISMGLLAEIKIDGRYGPGDIVPVSGDLQAEIRVLGPTWISATKVSLFANGVKIREAQIPPGVRGQRVLKWQGRWTLPRPTCDLHLVAIATGPGVNEPYWRIRKPYQPSTPQWTSYVIGSTGAVWIDADGDGRPTSAYDYARRLMKECGNDEECLSRRLSAYDEAVAAQVAGLRRK